MGADKREVPFVITPALSRLGGNKQQTPAYPVSRGRLARATGNPYSA